MENDNQVMSKSVISDFGDEWKFFNQKSLSNKELHDQFLKYFYIFPFEQLNTKSVGFDAGCGSGRWARFIAPLVGSLYLIEPSCAIDVAKENLSAFPNCNFINEKIENCEINESSMDFGYSLGVLHHIPDTQAALNICAKLLKPGAPFLLYLYYSLENRPIYYQFIWKASIPIRLLISKLPFPLKILITFFIALFIYLPLAKLNLLLIKLHLHFMHIPLRSYAHQSFYTMWTDSLDRFGTKLEKRYSKSDISLLLTNAGFSNIRFSELDPYWCVLATRL